MKNYSFQIVLCLAIVSTAFIHSCSKNSDDTKDSGITTSFTEEFKDVYALTHATPAKWVTKAFSIENVHSESIIWQQGEFGTDKGGGTYGFPAYSYSDSADEYAFSPGYFNNSISSWLISPVLSVKNGDKISFYSRARDGAYRDRMQVLMNGSASTDVGNSFNSVGSFETVLLDINQNQSEDGYPVTWTRYEYTFSGISGKINTRIAFRHFVYNPPDWAGNGVGIDVFAFQVK